MRMSLAPRHPNARSGKSNPLHSLSESPSRTSAHSSPNWRNKGNESNARVSMLITELESIEENLMKLQRASTLSTDKLSVFNFENTATEINKNYPDNFNQSSSYAQTHLIYVLFSLVFIALSFLTSFPSAIDSDFLLVGQFSSMLPDPTITKSMLVTIEIVAIGCVSIMAFRAWNQNKEMERKSSEFVKENRKKVEEMASTLNGIDASLKRAEAEISKSALLDRSTPSPDIRAVLNESPLAIDNPLNVKNSLQDVTERTENNEGEIEDEFSPKPGYRLNWMADSGVPFEPVLEALTEKQRNTFRAFSEMFLRRFESCTDVDRNKFYQTPDNFTMLRFLQADDYNIDLASNRLINTCVWRQKSGFDDFVSNPHKDALRLYFALRPRQLLGIGKDQRPFLVERIGLFFSDETALQGLSPHLWIMCYSFDISRIFQAMRETSIKNGLLIHRVNYIGDLHGTRFWSTMKMMPFLKMLTKEVELFFPEVTGYISLMNSSSIIEKLWGIAKRFLDPKVRYYFRLFLFTLCKISKVSNNMQPD